MGSQLLPPRSWGWILAQDVMRCVWRLAERAARAAAIDQMRLDIFIARGHPRDCRLNENSLSSGWGGVHRAWAARLWNEPHALGLYTVVGNASSPPVFMHGSQWGTLVSCVTSRSVGQGCVESCPYSYHL